MTFTPEIYEQIRQGAQRSAAVIVPLVFRLAPDVKTVVDVGCGEGWFAREFAAKGAEVFALDSEVETRDHFLGTGAGMLYFRKTDFVADAAPDAPRLACVEGRVFDLAVCLEVGEHLPESHAAELIETLCTLAPKVLFSAAIPGQGGHGHLNEQWPAYWAALFADHGYAAWDSLRTLLWDDEAVEPWYRQNILLFQRNPLIGDDFPPPRALVHPAIWEWRRQR